MLGAAALAGSYTGSLRRDHNKGLRFQGEKKSKPCSITQGAEITSAGKVHSNKNTTADVRGGGGS